MEMPEGWKRLTEMGKMIGYLNGVNVTQHALDLMKEMAEALDKFSKDRDFEQINGSRETAAILKKFKEWK